MRLAPLLAALVAGATPDEGPRASPSQLYADDACFEDEAGSCGVSLRQLRAGRHEEVPPAPGGAGVAQPASSDPTVQKMCEEMKDDVVAYLQNTTGGFEDGFDYFNAVSFCRQIVAGTNYYVLLTAGKNGFQSFYVVELKIFKPLPYMNAPPQLKSAKATGTSAYDWANLLHVPAECSKE
mmetsp:Transcript_46813/g.130344  ORF Transcript_46813/g.130344 Transcript_46813/m.130344 type:complete len:180 (-) Transcript_46813:86-625(-)